MKGLLVVLAAVGLLGVVPVIAAEKGAMKMDDKESVRNFALEAETIQQKIKRLEAEIAKGEKKIDAKELNKLKAKLKEANTILDQLNRQ